VVRFKPGKEMREIVAARATAVLAAPVPPPAPSV
jgi:hypothetical protein